MTEQLNIFKTLGITKNENIHSEFLAWLLSPYENHSLGSKFFIKIIKKLRENCKNYENRKDFDEKTEEICNALSNINISDNLQYLKVTREFSYKNNKNNENSDYGRFDILIRNSVGDNKFVCLIENKIDAPLGDKQLERYKDFLDKWKNYKKLYLFLSPTNDYCTWDNEKGYININYNFIKDVLENDIKEEITNNNTKSIIELYLEIIPTTKEQKYECNYKGFVLDKKNGEYRFEPKENGEYKNYYYTITDEKLGICIRPTKSGNPNIELIEKFEEKYGWKEKVYTNKEGYYWVLKVLKDLNNINVISDIISKTTEFFETQNTKNSDELKTHPSFCHTNKI